MRPVPEVTSTHTSATPADTLTKRPLEPPRTLRRTDSPGLMHGRCISPQSRATSTTTEQRAFTRSTAEPDLAPRLLLAPTSPRLRTRSSRCSQSPLKSCSLLVNSHCHLHTLRASARISHPHRCRFRRGLCCHPRRPVCGHCLSCQRLTRRTVGRHWTAHSRARSPKCSHWAPGNSQLSPADPKAQVTRRRLRLSGRVELLLQPSHLQSPGELRPPGFRLF